MLAKRMQRLGTETAFEVLARAKALEAQGKDIVHLSIGAPDFKTPENIVITSYSIHYTKLYEGARRAAGVWAR